MKQFTIGRVGLVLLATAAVCLSQAAVASAGGGNSANAKLCQKGGWQTLFRSDGSSFTNEEGCVSYAAQGGTLVKKTQSQIDCQSFGGTYMAGTAPTLWTCDGWTGSAVAYGILAVDCGADGGMSFATSGSEEAINSTCSAE